MHARITVQLLPHNPLACAGGESITDDQIADAIRQILDRHRVTGVRIQSLTINAVTMQPRLQANAAPSDTQPTR